MHVRVEVEIPGGGAPVSADRDLVDGDFLATLGIPLLRGRGFEARDDEGAGRVAIVNQTLAQRMWPAEDPVKQTILLRDSRGKATVVQVVGVARDAKYGSVWEAPQPHLYLPLAQGGLPANYLMVRTRARPADVVPAIRRQWQALEPRMPFERIRSGQEVVDYSLAPQRMAAGILAGFGLLAITLAAVGLYSVMAYSVGASGGRSEFGWPWGRGRRWWWGRFWGDPCASRARAWLWVWAPARG